jgi:hypothetical protein
MRLFFAGSEAQKFMDVLNECDVKNILMSYYWVRKNSDLEEFSKRCKIFLDSGGYSARKQGVEINVDEYGKFLERNKEYIFAAANLDVYDLNVALQNQKTLEQYFPVIPVFHYTEYAQGREDLLREFCEKYPYVALGGMAGTNLDKKLVYNFLNFCFKITTRYKIKVHGFGITAVKYLTEYPFFSVDSTTWLSGGQYGNILKWDRKNFHLDGSIHYSNRDKFLKYNLDTDLTGEYRGRIVNNVKELQKVEEDITALWRERGIVYDG